MRGSVSCSWLVGLLLSTGAVVPGAARAADYCDPVASPEVLANFEELLGARRESDMVTIPGDGQAPEISFIDSPSAT